MIKLIDLLEVSETGKNANSESLGGYKGFIKPEEWDAKKKSLKKSISNITGYMMVGNKELIKPGFKFLIFAISTVSFVTA